MLKKFARRVIVSINWKLASLYQSKFNPTIIGVAGSVGKSGTKRAIAHVIGSSKRVAWQDGNYNDLVTVPLIYFGLSEPSLFNPLAWFLTHLRMLKSILSRVGAEVVVLELGTDGKGQIKEFGKYLELDIAIVTAVTHEHMEFFGSLEEVAKEELSISGFAKQLFIQEDVVKAGYAGGLKSYKTYGSGRNCDIVQSTIGGQLSIKSDLLNIKTNPILAGRHQHNGLTVAGYIAAKLGINSQEIAKAIESLPSMPGRMNILDGLQGSIVVDDTYNSSPAAVYEALEYLYNLPTKHKIAVLGNMNEMGEMSKELHIQVGQKCDPKKLDKLITIGQDANLYLAEAAAQAGCQVASFQSPFEIGEHLLHMDLADTAILFKGSQNGVFLEEAIKPILANKNDSKRLVRQSKDWMQKKLNQFGTS